MRIKGKFCFDELKTFMIAAGGSLIVGLIIYGLFALLNFFSWAFCWILISAILTPVGFWFLQYQKENIVITDISEPPPDEEICIHPYDI